MKYSVADFRRAIRNPKLAIKELLYIKYTLAMNVNKRWYQRERPKEQTDVMEEDWDNLIILDAARPEFLSATSVELGGEYGTRISAGSESWSFMRENFAGETHHDTVYITANPHARKLEDSVFYKRASLIESEWNETAGTVPPDRVVERTIASHESHPNKRIISHFMQPHYPFLDSSLSSLGHINTVESEDDPWSQLNIWGMFADISRDEVISAYQKNHEIAAQAASKLATRLDGKTVITADHANLIGERGRPVPVRMYGHPPNFYKTELIRVPWIACDYDERRTVTAESPVSVEQQLDEQTVSERLAALGYT